MKKQELKYIKLIYTFYLNLDIQEYPHSFIIKNNFNLDEYKLQKNEKNNNNNNKNKNKYLIIGKKRKDHFSNNEQCDDKPPKLNTFNIMHNFYFWFNMRNIN